MYPEHDKLTTLSVDGNTIETIKTFLDWLYTNYNPPRTRGLYVTRQQVLAEYLGIDYAVFLQESDAMFAEMSELLGEDT